MKTNINKLSRLNYSNGMIASKLGVSVQMVHKHRKHFNALVDKAIGTHFFIKRLSLPKFTPKIKEMIIEKEGFFEKIKRYFRLITLPIYKLYQKIFYK